MGIPASCAEKPQHDFDDTQSFAGIAVGLQLPTNGTNGRAGARLLEGKSGTGVWVGLVSAPWSKSFMSPLARQQGKADSSSDNDS